MFHGGDIFKLSTSAATNEFCEWPQVGINVYIPHQSIISSLRDKMSYMEIRLNDLAQEQGSSSWLTILPIKRLGFNLSKSDFWDAVRLRYELPLKRLPSHCRCSKPYNVQQAVSCKKGGFVTLRHNELRDNIAEMLEEVTSDVEVEPALQPLSGEEIKGN